MHLIYIAGPYRAHNQFNVKTNIHRAELAGATLLQYQDLCPIIPHAMFAHWEGLRGEAFFLAATLEIMRRCDAVYLVPSDWKKSEGTVGEVNEANRLGIPVLYDQLHLAAWVEAGCPKHGIPLPARGVADGLAPEHGVPVLRP